MKFDERSKEKRKKKVPSIEVLHRTSKPHSFVKTDMLSLVWKISANSGIVQQCGKGSERKEGRRIARNVSAF